jgi:hypothetical protein
VSFGILKENVVDLGTAYTPGLKVSARTTIEKLRRLPLKGTVLVREGETVSPDTIVARTELPGIMQTVKLAERMGIEPADVPGVLRVKEGDRVQVGETLAETKGLFGRLFKSEFKSPVAGTVELISPSTGHVGIREAPTPVEKDAYIRGRVTKVIPEEGVVVACEGALVQGIFGVGGEQQGEIAVITSGPDQPITENSLTPAHRGKIVVGGSNVSGAALRKAAEVGVIGIVCGGVVDRELMDYLAAALNQPGYDIGVAITGQEPIPFTLVLTEGFGTIAMAERTFALFKTLEGKSASINGATQIRAGVIRPEVIVSEAVATPAASDGAEADSGQLGIGTPIRVIREPYFGILGTVTGLPPELVKVESETMVRVLQARLQDGRDVTVPRANVEIIQTI